MGSEPTDRPALPIQTHDPERCTSSETWSHPGSAPGSAIHKRERHPAAGNEQLGDVLDRVSDAVVALDREWRYTYVNHKAAELFGRNPHDLLGRHIWTEFSEGIGQPFHVAYEKALAEQVSVAMEAYYEPWDRWFENRIYPSADGVSIFFHEITDRKRAEQAALDSAALLEGQNQVLERIARGEPLERTLDMLLRFVEAQCPEMLCSILLPDGNGLHVRHGAAPSLSPTFTAAVQGSAGGRCPSAFAEAAFRSEVVIVDDIATHPLWEDCREVALEHGLRASWSSHCRRARRRGRHVRCVFPHP